MSDRDRNGREAADQRAQALLDAVARAGSESRERVTGAMEELFRPSGLRLSDLEKSASLDMLGELIGAIDSELRCRMLAHSELPLGPEFRESIASERVTIALPVLERAGVLNDLDLVALLLCRVDEYRLGAALRGRDGEASGGALDALLDDPDAAVADAAMAVLIAENRRNDRFDDPALAPAELPADLRHRLLWQTAAALRDYAAFAHDVDPVRLDPVFAASVPAILAAHDEGERLEAAALRLARLLQSSSALHDDVLVDALSCGRLTLYAAAIAARAGIDFEPAWEAVTGLDQSAHAVLLRAIDADDAVAARLLVAMTKARSGEGAGDHVAGLVEAWRALDVDDARAAIGVWRLDPTYRATIARLASTR